MSGPLVYRIDEAAELLGVGRSTLYDAVARDQIPGVLRVGRRILISKAALHARLGLPPTENGGEAANRNGADYQVG